MWVRQPETAGHLLDRQQVHFIQSFALGLYLSSDISCVHSYIVLCIFEKSMCKKFKSLFGFLCILKLAIKDNTNSLIPEISWDCSGQSSNAWRLHHNLLIHLFSSLCMWDISQILWWEQIVVSGHWLYPWRIHLLKALVCGWTGVSGVSKISRLCPASQQQATLA